MSGASWGCVTLCCRLLVIVRSLCLVVLFFEECFELRGGVLLFAVGCLLLCNRYVWSYWFSKNVSNFAVVCYSLLWDACYCAIVTSGRTSFRRMSRTSRWCATPCCGMLVIVRLLHLVVLVFEECLVVHVYRTASGCDFLAVNWVVGVI